MTATPVPVVTYRQLDYWTRLGHVKPEGSPTPGSGRRRHYTARELLIATRIKSLRDEGYGLELAARKARAEVESAP